MNTTTVTPRPQARPRSAWGQGRSVDLALPAAWAE
jgi:hypothetical protein